MRRVTSAPIVHLPVSAARAHVVGLVLLAVLLQAFAPLLHARLLSAHAAATGERLDVAAFCLPSHTPLAQNPDGAPPLPASPDCLLCQGGAPAVADVPAPSVLAPPAAPVAASDAAPRAAGIRAGAVAIAHRPRGPPSV